MSTQKSKEEVIDSSSLRECCLSHHAELTPRVYPLHCILSLARGLVHVVVYNMDWVNVSCLPPVSATLYSWQMPVVPIALGCSISSCPNEWQTQREAQREAWVGAPAPGQPEGVLEIANPCKIFPALCCLSLTDRYLFHTYIPFMLPLVYLVT